jgi:cobalt/nickel transport system permease protein
MIQETFATGNSPIHRMDPRLKLIACTVFSFQTALSMAFLTLLTGFLAGVSMLAVGRLDFRVVCKRLFLINGFILLFWFVVPVTFPGTSVFSVGPLNFTMEGILLSARITIKSNAIMIAFMALLGTSSLAVLGHAMSCLKIPDKLVHLFLLTYRYLFVIEQEYHRLARAARVRCFQPATSLHTYKTYAYLIGMLFVRASVRAERVYHAMLCRGFNRKFYSLQKFCLTRMDWLWVIFFGFLVLIMGFFEWIKIITL